MLTVAILTLAAAQMLPATARAGLKVFDSDDMKLELGLRLQSRLELERVDAAVSRKQWIHDFLIRRTRFKMNGKAHKAAFNFEWKIDRTDGFGASPSASVENAWVQYPLGAGVELRTGLYDQPFSRDRLTSDSKQLAVDRGAVSNTLDALGLVDNAVGFDLRGRVRDGRADYVIGVFDNRVPTAAVQGTPMVVGRLDFNLGSTKDIYKDTHFGKDSWYSVAVNGSYQGEIENAAGQHEGSLSAGGVDGMVDVPVGETRVFGRSEVNVVKAIPAAGGNSLDTTTWMVGAGISLFHQRFQPIVRFDEVRLDAAAGGGVKDITYVGANLYQREHLLKIQGDVRLESGTHRAVDGGRLQAQLDF